MVFQYPTPLGTGQRACRIFCALASRALARRLVFFRHFVERSFVFGVVAVFVLLLHFVFRRIIRRPGVRA
eukprot:scaffold1466_cov159-Amphora_coffeaeformis.AAC.4